MSTPSEIPNRIADDVSNTADKMTATSRTALNAGLEAARTGAETSNDMASAAADATQSVTRTATEGAQALSAEAVQRSGQGLQAMTDLSLEAAGRLRELSGEWAAVAQQGAERSLERFQALAGARSPESFMAAQRSLLWGGFQDFAEAQQRLAGLAMRLWEGNLNRLTTAPRALAGATAA